MARNCLSQRTIGGTLRWGTASVCMVIGLVMAPLVLGSGLAAIAAELTDNKSAPVIQADGRRDPWLWPFATDSIWNQPIGSAARYVPAGLQPAKYVAIDDELFYRIQPGAPRRPVYAPKSWETRAGGSQFLGEIPFNDSITVPDARQYWTPNFCSALLLEDGRTLKHLAPLCRPESGGPVYGYIFDGAADLFGDGIGGSHGGSGLSALGGSIRRGELLGDEPLRHALKVVLFCKPYVQWTAANRGFRWPATQADGYAEGNYEGKNPALLMGALLAIPPTVTLEQSGVTTPVGRKVFRAFQDYGAYLVDDSAWDCHYLCAEQGVKEEVEQQLGLKLEGDSGPVFDDINRLFPLLQVIDNNGPERVGGGGQPRVALAPPLSETAADPPGPHPPAQVPFRLENPSMTDGDDKPTHWSNPWTGNGEIAVSRDTKVFVSAPASLRIDSVGGPAHGLTSQLFEGKAGQAFRVRAKINAAGKATALFGAQAYNDSWSGIEFKAFGNALAGLDWQDVSGTMVLPEGTRHYGFVLTIEGDGQVWLDDVSAEWLTEDEQADMLSKDAKSAQRPAAPANAWSAGEGFYPDFPQAWRQIVDGQLQRARDGGGRVIFIGDSLTQGISAAVWDKQFAPLTAVNFGIGGDGTPQVLWRIEAGILDGYKADVVVLMIGINNTWPGYSAADTTRGIETCVQAIRKKQPQAKVLLLGVVPIFDRDDGIRATIREINTGIAKLARGRDIKFVDLSSEFVTKEGDRKPGWYTDDRLHWTDTAYERFGQRVRRELDTLLKK